MKVQPPGLMNSCGKESARVACLVFVMDTMIHGFVVETSALQLWDRSQAGYEEEEASSTCG